MRKIDASVSDPLDRSDLGYEKRNGDPLVGKQRSNNILLRSSMPKSPQVLQDVLFNLPLARDRSSDLVQSRRLDVRDAFPRAEVDRHVEESVGEDFGHLEGCRKKTRDQIQRGNDEKAKIAKGKKGEQERSDEP